MTQHAIIMLTAGLGIPVLAALNARLGSNIGSPAAAGLILFLVALIATAATMLVTGGTSAMSALATQPRHLFLAGILVAFYVLSITWIAPVFGVGNAVFFVLLGQLVSAAAIDHFGLFGAQATALSPVRLGGILLMTAGVALTQFAQKG